MSATVTRWRSRRLRFESGREKKCQTFHQQSNSVRLRGNRSVRNKRNTEKTRKLSKIWIMWVSHELVKKCRLRKIQRKKIFLASVKTRVVTIFLSDRGLASVRPFVTSAWRSVVWCWCSKGSSYVHLSFSIFGCTTFPHFIEVIGWIHNLFLSSNQLDVFSMNIWTLIGRFSTFLIYSIH